MASLQLSVEDIEEEAGLSGFSAFCSRLSPTDPAVMKEEMTWLVQTSTTLGNQWAIITRDKITHELVVDSC
jgi:hypothetical protein